MEPSRPSLPRVLRAALVGGALGAALNALLYLAARAAGWVRDDILVETPGGMQPISCRRSSSRR